MLFIPTLMSISGLSQLFGVRTLLVILTIAMIYVLWKTVRPSVIIQRLAELPVKRTSESLKLLKGEENLIVLTLAKNEGKMLQKELITKTSLPSYKVTRALNRLEKLGVITRQKYGMTNMVFLNLDSKKVLEAIV